MFDIDFDKKLQERDKKERMRIIQLMSQNKNKGEKRIPKKQNEKLYHCDSQDDE